MQALHQDVRPATEVPGEAAEQDADEEGHGHPDEPDGKGNAGAVEDAAEQVAAEIVGAEQKQRRPLRGGEQVQGRR